MYTPEAHAYFHPLARWLQAQPVPRAFLWVHENAEGDDSWASSREDSRLTFQLAVSMLAAVSSRFPAPACPPAAHSSPPSGPKQDRAVTAAAATVVRVHQSRLCVNFEPIVVQRGHNACFVAVVVRAPWKDLLPDRSFLELLEMTM